MKIFAASLLLVSSVSFAKGNDLNCEINAKKVHAKSQQTCEKRKGKWLVVAAAEQAKPSTVPATTAPAVAAPATAPVAAPTK